MKHLLSMALAIMNVMLDIKHISNEKYIPHGNSKHHSNKKTLPRYFFCPVLKCLKTCPDLGSCVMCSSGSLAGNESTPFRESTALFHSLTSSSVSLLLLLLEPPRCKMVCALLSIRGCVMYMVHEMLWPWIASVHII